MTLFENLLRRHEHERHTRVLGELGRLRRDRKRTHDEDGDGFMPPKQAAEAMGWTQQEILHAAAAGFLEAKTTWGGRVLVRPAVLTVVGMHS